MRALGRQPNALARDPLYLHYVSGARVFANASFAAKALLQRSTEVVASRGMRAASWRKRPVETSSPNALQRAL